MQKNLERLLPFHLNNKPVVEGLAEIHRHGGFRPRNRADAPRFFSGLGSRIFWHPECL
jgi:hypothetical protein